MVPELTELVQAFSKTSLCIDLFKGVFLSCKSNAGGVSSVQEHLLRYVKYVAYVEG